MLATKRINMSVPEKPFDSDDSRQTGKDSGDRPARRTLSWEHGKENSRSRSGLIGTAKAGKH